MKKILIADDEPHVIRVSKNALERAGYEVDTASNGSIALEKLRQQQPDVLITDVDMPVMSGTELCACIEKEHPERRFLIIVLTSKTALEHREWSLKTGNSVFLEKPISLRKLASDLEEYFSNGTFPGVN